VHIQIDLFFDRFNYFGMAMAGITYRYAGDKVNVLFSVGAVHVNTLSPYNFEHHWCDRSLSQVLQEQLTISKHEKF
jgi:hypothetical protein